MNSDSVLIDKEGCLENCYIYLETELKYFLKSCGNSMSEEEINYMIKLANVMGIKEKVTNKQLQFIWAIFIYFQKKKPEEILEFVFENYLEELKSKENDDMPDFELNKEKLKKFLIRFNGFYFTEAQKNHLLEEVDLLGKSFTVREFSLAITIPRRFHPN